MLFLVTLGNKYEERIPGQLGTLVIDYMVVTMTRKELQQASDTWKQVHLNTII